MAFQTGLKKPESELSILSIEIGHNRTNIVEYCVEEEIYEILSKNELEIGG